MKFKRTTTIIALLLAMVMTVTPVFAGTYQLDEASRKTSNTVAVNLNDNGGYFLACNKIMTGNIYTCPCILTLTKDKTGTRLMKPFQVSNANSLQKVRFYSVGEPLYYKVKLGNKWLKGNSGVTSSQAQADTYKVYWSTKSQTLQMTNTRTKKAYNVWGKGNYFRVYYAAFPM